MQEARVPSLAGELSSHMLHISGRNIKLKD